MVKVQYDAEGDIFTAEARGKKVYKTIEFSEHFLVDINEDGKILGVELLDASDEISKIFGRVVRKDEIKQLLCKIKEEPDEGYLISFQSPKNNNQRASYMISLYKSPLLS